MSLDLKKENSLTIGGVTYTHYHKVDAFRHTRYRFLKIIVIYIYIIHILI